jgi:hypothetical protein
MCRDRRNRAVGRVSAARAARSVGSLRGDAMRWLLGMLLASAIVAGAIILWLSANRVDVDCTNAHGRPCVVITPPVP